MTPSGFLESRALLLFAFVPALVLIRGAPDHVWEIAIAFGVAVISGYVGGLIRGARWQRW